MQYEKRWKRLVIAGSLFCAQGRHKDSDEYLATGTTGVAVWILHVIVVLCVSKIQSYGFEMEQKFP